MGSLNIRLRSYRKVKALKHIDIIVHLLILRLKRRMLIAIVSADRRGSDYVR